MNNMISLGISNDKKNKTRSILTMICIVLTSMLLTVIASFCNASMELNVMNAEQVYGSFHGAYNNIGEEILQELERRSELAQIGKMASAGIVDAKEDLRIYSTDSQYRQMAGLKNALGEGKYPQGDNEITAQKGFFELIGYQNPQIGDKIKLTSRLDEASLFSGKEMVISGFLQENPTGIKQKSWIGFVSEAFYNSQAREGSRLYNVFFRFGENMELNTETAKSVIKDIADQYQITERQVKYNMGYIVSSLAPGTEIIMGGIFIGLCVVVFSAIVIYNIFQVGLVQKIQEYGKLKALGATRSQIKSVVLTEGLILAFIGIPMGVLFGALLNYPIFISIMEQMKKQYHIQEMAMPETITLPIVLLAVAVSGLTVCIALAKPMRIVAKLSPMEAVRYQENTLSKKNIRKGCRDMGVAQMTMASIAASRKRTISTIFTMGLSCVMFVMITSLVGNIDNAYEARNDVEFGQFKISLDYSLNDKAYPENNLDQVLKRNPLGDDFLERIHQIREVTKVDTSKVVVMEELDASGQSLGNIQAAAVLSKEQMDFFAGRSTNKGNMDYHTAAENDSIIYGWINFLERTGHSIDQPYYVRISDGTRETVLDTAIQGSFGLLFNDLAITEATYEKLGFDSQGIENVWVDCDPQDVASVEKQINQILADYEDLELETYEDALKILERGSGLMELIAYTLLGILGIIGFMNMANTIIINIATRKQEIGVLQAIGMTNRQLNKMLQMEGLLFSVGTVLVSLLIGIPAGYGCFYYGKVNGLIGLNVYRLPLGEISLMVAAIAGLQVVLSYILSRNVRRETLVERIRYQQ